MRKSGNADILVLRLSHTVYFEQSEIIAYVSLRRYTVYGSVDFFEQKVTKKIV